MQKFRMGDVWVLICTDLMARGIDFKTVNSVLNFDFPTSLVSYIHRVGRTGRAGREGTAITYFTDADLPLRPHHRQFDGQIGPRRPRMATKAEK